MSRYIDADPYTKADIQKMQDLEQAEIEKAFELGRQDGLWEMFERISTAYHGKQYYFRQDNGMVYSRDSHKELQFGEAVSEFLRRVNEL